VVTFPALRGTLVGLAGATTSAKDELAAAMVAALSARGRDAIVIGNRRGPDPEASPQALRSVNGRGLEAAVMVSRLAENSALRISRTVINRRPVFDELARLRAAREFSVEYPRHHLVRHLEESVAGAAHDYDFVLWLRSRSGSESLRAFESALGAVLLDLGVQYRVLTPPFPAEAIEHVVAPLCGSRGFA
jgi:hypothetical protein